MATYASVSNPFIQADEPSPPATSSSNGRGSNGAHDDQVAKTKNAPGMARPQSLLDELKKQQKESEHLMLDEGFGGGELSKASTHTRSNALLLDENNNESKSKGEGCEDKDKQDAGKMPTAKTEDVELELELEIERTCRSLVEQVAQMSISPDGNQVDSINITTTSIAGEESIQVGFQQTPKLQRNGQTRRTFSELLNDDDGEAQEEGSLSPTSLAGDKTGVERAPMEQDTRQHQHIELIKKLRLQLRDLERYAYERGELQQVPPSVLAERQTVILETLRKKLSLNLDKDKIEKLELEELKRQVDDEINQLIDPLITKEHLLNQLKTQLTDLERYISHLHGTIGKSDKSNNKAGNCVCRLHGCTSSSTSSSAGSSTSSADHSPSLSAPNGSQSSMLSSDTLPKTSRLIRGLMAQLICSDMKIQEAMRLEKDYNKFSKHIDPGSTSGNNDDQASRNITTKAPQFHDGAAWTLHIDRAVLATDSLTNLFSLTPKRHVMDARLQRALATVNQQQSQQVDNSLVESVVRRQLVPALRDLLAYGLIDPSTLPPRTSYTSFLFDPYYLLSSLTCLPGSQVKSSVDQGSSSLSEKVHVWEIIEDYYDSRNEPNFRTSSVKTLSQSFNLTPSMDGPIKVTSKQALLIAIDDIMERLAKCKPNGPESHFKLFVYTALNQGKLATWIRIIFRNKSILRKYYHPFSFVSQPEKMDKLLATIEALSQYKFNIDTDTQTNDQFVSAF